MTAYAHIVDAQGDVVGHVCGTENALLRTGTVEPRWCPRCRMQILHRLEVRGDREPSYWEPVAVWTCRRCRGWEKVAAADRSTDAGEEA